MKKFKGWLLNHPWEIPVVIDLWLISPYPVPKWRRLLSLLLSPLTKIAVNRWDPETLESPPGWSPRRWSEKDKIV